MPCDWLWCFGAIVLTLLKWLAHALAQSLLVTSLMSQTQETVDRAGCCDNAGRASGTVGVHSKVLPIHFGEKTQALLSLKGLVWPELWAGHASVCVCCVTIITWKIHQHQQMIAQDTW